MAQRGLVLLLMIMVLFARTKVHEEKGRGNFGIPFSFDVSNYQDLSASSMRYRGIGGTIGFEYTHYFSKGNEVKGSFEGFFSSYHSTVNSVSTFRSFGMELELAYAHLFPLSEKFSLLIGSEIHWWWDLMSNPNLNNNSFSGIFENPFFLKVGGENYFKNGHPLRYGVGVALFGFLDRTNGFSFSERQTTLEDGDFSYTSDFTLGYSQSQFYGISSRYFRLFTTIAYQFHRRWEVEYRWDLLRSSYKNLDEYPLTSGKHSFAMTFLF